MKGVQAFLLIDQFLNTILVALDRLLIKFDFIFFYLTNIFCTLSLVQGAYSHIITILRCINDFDTKNFNIWVPAY